MPKRIYRRCPACGAARPGADFKRAAGKPDWGLQRPTCCPQCGHVGQLQTFPRVDPPATVRRLG
jgi:hypothetical protein